MEILEMAIDLSHNDSKYTRKRIDTEVRKLQILMRLSKDLAFMDMKKYEHVSTLLQEIDDMLSTRGHGDGQNLRQFIH